MKKIKRIDDVLYQCEQSTDLKEGDLFVQSYREGNWENFKHTLNKVTYTNKTSNLIRYDKISGPGIYSFGFTTFRSMQDVSKYLGFKCIMELETSFLKVVGTYKYKSLIK